MSGSPRPPLPTAGEKRSRTDTKPPKRSEPQVTSIKYGRGHVMQDNPALKSYVSRVCAYMARYQHWASRSFARAMWDAAASAEPGELSKPATIVAALRLPWTSKYMPDWADPTHKWLHETTVPLRDFDFSYDVN